MAGVAMENEIAQITESRFISVPPAKLPTLSLPMGDAISGIGEKTRRQPHDRRRIDEQADWRQPWPYGFWPATPNCSIASSVGTRRWACQSRLRPKKRRPFRPLRGRLRNRIKTMPPPARFAGEPEIAAGGR